MQQVALFAVREREKAPAPQRKRLAGKLVSFRYSSVEVRQLLAVAKREDMTVSELIRDALYEQYRIGELRKRVVMEASE